MGLMLEFARDVMRERRDDIVAAVTRMTARCIVVFSATVQLFAGGVGRGQIDMGEILLRGRRCQGHPYFILTSIPTSIPTSTRKQHN